MIVELVGDKKMRKNRKEKKYGKLVVISLFVILVAMSAAQAIVGLDNTSEDKTPYGNGDARPLGAPPFYTWEDDFDTMEWIDPDLDMSYDFEVVNGKVQMKNTYFVWTDPDWTRLKPITLTNNVGQVLLNFAINLIVEFDTDMQSDYDDIRFKHENTPTNFLNYWIESYDSSEANVWVRLPFIPTGTSTMYLFYGNSNAESESDYSSVFTEWQEKWANDQKISIHANNEGAWDPDVAYGNNRFLVAWEEGTTIFIQQEIRGTIFDTDGNIIVNDFEIFTQQLPYTPFRNENPSIAFGGSNFFVAWEKFGEALGVTDETTINILGRLVTTSGGHGGVINICNASNRQADPNVEFDSVNNRFCVVWEDARINMYNYNIYGKLYDTNGNQIGSEKSICVAGNNQFEPWIAFDPIHEQYMIVWEEGIDPDTVPFSLKAGIFDENLNPVSGVISIANGNSNTDYIYPCVEFCAETERYLVTWNSGDISQQWDRWGNIYGKILDESGYVVVDTFTIKSGEFARTDIVPYLTSSFFVSFNSKGAGSEGESGLIWGKLVFSDGEVFADDIQLSASQSALADWANMAVYDGKIFVAWEDERIDTYTRPDVYGNMWQLNIPTGSEVSYSFGTEKKLILEAQITSKVIQPDNLVSWYEFWVEYSGSITFDILAANGNVLISGASNGEDLSGIDPDSHPGIRLRAHFTRENPSYTPALDSWNVVYVGIDEVPPETTIRDTLGTPGKNGWYTSNVKILLDATDGMWGSGVDVTYYQIDDDPPQEYDDNVGVKLPPYDPNVPSGEWDVRYWSVDKAGNEEPKQGPVHIKIDKALPYSEIWDPPDRGTVKGDFWVQTIATDVGSGIEYVKFDTGPPYGDPVTVYNPSPPPDNNYKWLCTRHLQKQWQHIIAQAYDYAGNMYESNIYVYFANPKVFSFPASGSSSSPSSSGSSTSGSQTLMGSMVMKIGQTGGTSIPLNSK